MPSVHRLACWSCFAFFLPVGLFAADPPARGASARDSAGNTPLHLAALRGDADALDRLLAAGADPNALNEAGATPLHYAVASERMVAALLARDAKPDVVSKIGVTPLLGAVSRPDSFPVARQLIAAGANVNAHRSTWVGLLGSANVLALAVAHGDRRTIDLLLERKAELNPPPQTPMPGAITGTTPLMAAALAGSVPIARELVKRGAELDASRGLPGTALNTAFFAGQADVARFLIEQGADLTLPSGRGYATPPIVWSAYNDTGDATVTKLLVARGVDVNAANEAGETALSYALRRGTDTELVRYLRSVGAKEPVALPREKPARARELPPAGEARRALVRASAQRAVDLLQRNSTAFLENGFVRNAAKCVSCHQQALPAVAFGLARERGLRIDEAAVGRLLAATIAVRASEVENARQMDEPTPGGGTTLGYDADALHAMNYASNEMMETFSRYLLAVQHADGSWSENVRRPPMEDGPLVRTAWALRAVQLYPPAGRAREVSDAMRRAQGWLGQQRTLTHNDRVFQLLGLAWAGAESARMKPFAEALLRSQGTDGGWAQLPALAGDAWATGSALVALHKAGIAPAHAGYQRGVEFLLRTQFDDGSWWVRSRSWPFQPHFDGKFPHGKDQWISAAGTAWATMALLLTLEPTVDPQSLPNGQQLIAAFEKASSERPGSAVAVAASATVPDAAAIDFSRDIQPIFERSCVGCHGGNRAKAGFTLDTRAALLRGGQSGDAAIVPGDAEASPLFRQVAGVVEDLEMPPLNRREKYPAVTAEELERIRQWINAGAPWGAARTVDATLPGSPGATITSSR